MNFKGRDIIDINDFSKEELLFILKTAKKFDPTFVKSDRSNYTIAQGKIAALLFLNHPPAQNNLSNQQLKK